MFVIVAENACYFTVNSSRTGLNTYKRSTLTLTFLPGRFYRREINLQPGFECRKLKIYMRTLANILSHFHSCLPYYDNGRFRCQICGIILAPPD